MQEPGVRPLGQEGPLERAWLTSLAFLPGESLGQRSLVGSSPWGRKELGAAEHLVTHPLPILGMVTVYMSGDLASVPVQLPFLTLQNKRGAGCSGAPSPACAVQSSGAGWPCAARVRPQRVGAGVPRRSPRWRPLSKSWESGALLCRTGTSLESVLAFLFCVSHIYMQSAVYLVISLGMRFCAACLEDLARCSFILYLLSVIYVHIFPLIPLGLIHLPMWLISLYVCLLIISNNLKLFFGKYGLLVNY